MLSRLALLMLCCLSAVVIAQSPEALKYAPRTIVLVSPELGTEGIVMMLLTTDGQQRLEFVPTSQIKDAQTKGGQPIRLGDVLSLLGGNTETINKLQAENARLQAENDKLWKVAMKSEAVVVQSSPPPEPSQAEIAAQQQSEANTRRQQALQMWMVLQGHPQSRPYQLPMPVNPNANRLQTNCTTYRLGDITHTTCD